MNSGGLITSSTILNCCCTILNKLVVNLLKGTTIQSIASIETYCQILMLLIKLKDVYKSMSHIIREEVEDMLQSQLNRRKNKLGDIGEFLVKLAFSKYGLTNSDVNQTLIQEYSARQVYWVMKDIGKSEVKGRGLHRAKNFFNSSIVSHQLFVFNIEAAKTFINPVMIAKLEENYGFPDDETMNRFLKRISWVKQNVKDFKKFFECVGLSDRIDANNSMKIHEYLDRAIAVSDKQGYTQNFRN